MDSGEVSVSECIGWPEETWADITRVIEERSRFVITAHQMPDCDALGSELALDEILRKLGKKTTIINSDPMPKAYRFLDPRKRIKTFNPQKHLSIIKEADAIFLLDAGEWHRAGEVGEHLSSNYKAIVLCIDHHDNPTNDAHYAVVDPSASATAALIFDLACRLDVPLTKSMAEALYAGIVTDTGKFRYPQTSARTHLIAARLLEAGVYPNYMHRMIYEQYPLDRTRLKGHLLDSIRTTADGKLAWVSVRLETLREYNTRPSEMDGFPALPMQVGGVKVSVFCVEVSPGVIKVGLRSDGEVSVNHLADELGGGGHPSAAGLTLRGELEEVTRMVVDRACELL
jgi:phosphoesterase RecJ-like protein